MIYAETWVPGTYSELDSLFEKLRKEFYEQQDHYLWKNYSADSFKDCTVLSIAFDDEVPIFCSSVLGRNEWHKWPEHAYRVMNRYWRINNHRPAMKRMSEGTVIMVKNQIDWLKENTDCQLAFISRQSNNWQQFAIKSFREIVGIEFQSDNYSYCTCETPNDDSCWQRIIYQGDSSLLETWKRR
jgi:hypothetical protein